MSVRKRIWYGLSYARLASARNAEVHPTGTRVDEIAARAISYDGIPMGNPARAHGLPPKRRIFNSALLSSEKQ